MNQLDVWICRWYRVLRPLPLLIFCVAVPIGLGATWWSTASCVLGVVFFVALVLRYQPRHFEPAWREMAQQLGVEFVPRLGDGAAFVRGEINGRFITLTPHNPLPKWNQPAQTVIQVALDNSPYRFSFYNASPKEREARATFNKRRGIGVPELDARFVFQGGEERPLTPIFTSDLTRQLARIGDSPTQQRITVEANQLTYRANGILLKVNSLVFLIELMAQLAGAVETGD